MERGENEDERERIRRRNEKADHPERQQGAALTREPLFRSYLPSRQEAAARDDPACGCERDEDDERGTRPGDGVE